MSLVPWPVKRLTRPDDVDARVQRTWVRLERTRRAPRSVRSGFLVAAASAACALAAWAWAARAPGTAPGDGAPIAAAHAVGALAHAGKSAEAARAGKLASVVPSSALASADGAANPRADATSGALASAEGAGNPRADATSGARTLAAHAVGALVHAGEPRASPPGVGGAPPASRAAQAPATVVWRGRPTPGAPRPPFMLRLPSSEAAPEDVVEVLLASADEAWRAGDSGRAAVLLSELAAHHPDDARAGSALYVLGQLQLDVLGRPDAAVDSFERALALGVPDSLVGPLWEAHERASAEAGAR